MRTSTSPPSANSGSSDQVNWSLSRSQFISRTANIPGAETSWSTETSIKSASASSGTSLPATRRRTSGARPSARSVGMASVPPPRRKGWDRQHLAGGDAARVVDAVELGDRPPERGVVVLLRRDGGQGLAALHDAGLGHVGRAPFHRTGLLL